MLTAKDWVIWVKISREQNLELPKKEITRQVADGSGRTRFCFLQQLQEFVWNDFGRCKVSYTVQWLVQYFTGL